MGMSETINDLAAALVAAQGELTHPHKNSEAIGRGGRTYRYADLKSVLDCVRQVLAHHGLAVTQVGSGSEEGMVWLDTRLIHTSGQWISSTLPLPTDVGPQEFGSAMTYARRYALSAILGVAADDDDDGVVAQEAPPRPQAAPRTAPEPSGDNLRSEIAAEAASRLMATEKGLVREWYEGKYDSKPTVKKVEAALLGEARGIVDSMDVDLSTGAGRGEAVAAVVSQLKRVL